MKVTFVSSLLLAAGLLAGCSKSESTSATPAAPASATPAAATAPISGPRTINLVAGVDNLMKFDVATITASPGEELKVVLTNSSMMAKDVAGHNWVLLQAGTDVTAFVTAAAGAKDSLYIPPALKDQILAHIDQLGPKQSGEVTFKAPAAPGEYTYLCTFPAHYLLGMKGVLVVK